MCVAVRFELVPKRRTIVLSWLYAAQGQVEAARRPDEQKHSLHRCVFSLKHLRTNEKGGEIVFPILIFRHCSLAPFPMSQHAFKAEHKSKILNQRSFGRKDEHSCLVRKRESQRANLPERCFLLWVDGFHHLGLQSIQDLAIAAADAGQFVVQVTDHRRPERVRFLPLHPHVAGRTVFHLLNRRTSSPEVESARTTGTANVSRSLCSTYSTTDGNCLHSASSSSRH